MANLLKNLPLLGVGLILCACTAMPELKANPASCEALKNREMVSGALASLDLLTDFAEIGCHAQAIELGNAIRKTYRHKDYSVSTEVLSLFVPEEMLSEYVLESFERAFLSFFMASEYLKLGLKDEAAVELRRSYSEGRALLYNYGDDPVNMMLMAALWDNLGEADSARPFWQRLANLLPATHLTHKLATDRLKSIDRGGPRSEAHWKIVGLGRLPQLEWSLVRDERHDSYFTLNPLGELPSECNSAAGTLLPTTSWLEKIRHRYAADYHPLLHVKSWVRMPIGLAYGLTTISAGVGLAFAGCAVDGGSKGSGDLCHASMQAGIELISQAGNATRFALRPDLRHWRRLPAAILITKDDDVTREKCWREQPEPIRLVSFAYAN